jgi:geranylgeranyl diphosphate synthase type II
MPKKSQTKVQKPGRTAQLTVRPAKRRIRSSKKAELWFDLPGYLKARRREVDAGLEHFLPPADRHPETLHRAMRHSLLSGGKRLRPILVLAAAEACGVPRQRVLPAACALEFIHTYSLIHDDLPAMDDDDLRRGRPTCHKVFGEAAAILAGDALLTAAFELLAGAQQRRGLAFLGTRGAGRQLQATALLASAAGMAGMVGGQMADIEAEGKAVDLPALQYIHVHKTGKLLQASVLVGALLSGASAAALKSLGAYGESLGLAFQIMDDVLDVAGDKEKLGKNTGGDAAKAKATYPAFFGLEESRREAGELCRRALASLRVFGAAAEPLRALAKFVVEREV